MLATVPDPDETDPAPPEVLDLAAELVPVATRLVVAVRDEGPDAVKDVLATVPQGRVDALAVILAGMVDPDRTVRSLLAWSLEGPVPTVGHPPLLSGREPREHGTQRGYRQHRRADEDPCDPCSSAHAADVAARRAA